MNSPYVSLSLSLNPSSALVSPSPAYRRARAIDSPPLAINRSSPRRRVSRYVAIVGQDRRALARPHIAAPFCVPSKMYGERCRRSSGGATRSFRRGRRSGRCGCAARYPRYFASGPASQNQPPSTVPYHPAFPPSSLSAPRRSVADWLLTRESVRVTVARACPGMRPRHAPREPYGPRTPLASSWGLRGNTSRRVVCLHPRKTIPRITLFSFPFSKWCTRIRRD